MCAIMSDINVQVSERDLKNIEEICAATAKHYGVEMQMPAIAARALQIGIEQLGFNWHIPAPP